MLHVIDLDVIELYIPNKHVEWVNANRVFIIQSEIFKPTDIEKLKHNETRFRETIDGRYLLPQVLQILDNDKNYYYLYITNMNTANSRAFRLIGFNPKEEAIYEHKAEDMILRAIIKE